METLKVKASDEVSVKDVFVELISFFQEFVIDFGEVFPEVEKEIEARETNNGRAPPTLRVQAREVVNTSDRFGPR